MDSFLVLIIAAIAVAAYAVYLYNKLVRLKNTVGSSWSDIDVLLKKRYNLVDNLVDTVKGYAKHEKSVFQEVTEARTRAMGAGSPKEQGKAENIFKDTLKSLFAVAEAYPDLKANTNFLELQKQLEKIESDIEYARRYYNAVVRDFNSMTEMFPSNIIASRYGFTGADFFELDTPEARKVPKVSFGN